MGAPFQLVFANVFIVNFEKNRLQICPPSRKPHVYTCYDDDDEIFVSATLSATLSALSSGVALYLYKSTIRPCINLPYGLA